MDRNNGDIVLTRFQLAHSMHLSVIPAKLWEVGTFWSRSRSCGGQTFAPTNLLTAGVGAVGVFISMQIS